MQHVILIIVALVASFFFYKRKYDGRKQEYLKKTDLTPAERQKEDFESWKDQLILLGRFVIFGLAAVFAFLGNVLGIILTVIFTGEALVYLYLRSRETRSRSQVYLLTCLAVPFGVTIYCAIDKLFRAPLIGILVAVAIPVYVHFEPIIDDWLDERRENKSDDDTISRRKTKHRHHKGDE